MIELTDDEIIAAIKASSGVHSIAWAKETKCNDDQVFCEHNGASTGRIAKTLNLEINKARGMLNKLAVRGLIRKSKDNGGKQCLWWPVGYLAELKSVSVPTGGDV